ncbi:glutamate receptor ionotropic, delta-1-like [Panulirus ornatus]|uniref:glutamate receptor ionotropic, delta-1-like n=1 Tax=Panulirus ornatus TaxID=150431 RepID=UPI003A89AC1B
MTINIRETVVDFTMHYYLGSTVLVSPAPKERSRSFAILSTFTFEVWLCICLVTVLVGPLLYMVTRLLVVYLDEEDSVHYSLQSFSFNMYRNLMVQGNRITSHRWSLRFIFITWYFFSFYIQALYSGTLTAVLAVTSFEKPIDSLHQLPEAHRNGYTIGAIRDTSRVEAFQSAKSGIFQEVWELFTHEDPDQSFVTDADVGFDMIQKQKYVFISSQLNSELKAVQRGRKKFHIGRHTFLPDSIGIVCNTGSPVRDAFNRILVRLTEVGLIYKWTNDEVNKVSTFMSEAGDPGPSAITLQHLQAAFIIMALGFAMSGVVLVVEVLMQVKDHRRQSGRPGYWETPVPQDSPQIQ